MKIALVIRRAEHDLAVGVEIFPWNSHGAVRFEDQMIFARDVVGHEPISRAARDNDVVKLAVGELAVGRLNRSAPAVDEDHFIGAAIAEEGLLLLLRSGAP